MLSDDCKEMMECARHRNRRLPFRTDSAEREICDVNGEDSCRVLDGYSYTSRRCAIRSILTSLSVSSIRYTTRQYGIRYGVEFLARGRLNLAYVLTHAAVRA